MPNHISNRLELIGDPDEIAKLLAEIKDPTESRSVISFNKILPRPDGVWWYDWNIANWGTKWNAYDQEALPDGRLYFETAWSAPLPVIEALAAAHPDIRFRLEYADEDIGANAGIVSFEGGCLEYVPLEDSDAARLWFDLNPDCDPVDYDYDPDTYEYVEAA